MDTLDLAPGLALPLAELEFSFTRAGGPGGQHVNRAETKVELRWDVAQSPILNEEQRALLLARLASYLTTEGVLRLTSDERRSQHRNREAVVLRLQALVSAALRPRRPRRATRPTASAQAKRLDKKRQQSEKKARRVKIRARDV